MDRLGGRHMGYREEEEDILVIEDNTIYEIDMQCMKCKTGHCHESEKRMEKYEKKAYNEWINQYRDK